MVKSVSTVSISIEWTLDEEFSADVYTISYRNTDCPNVMHNDITVSHSMMVNLTDLEEGTTYSITVHTTLNGGRGTQNDTTTAGTNPTG